MSISGTGGAFGMYNPTSGATKTTKTGDEVEFSKGVLSCVSAGNQKTIHICLMTNGYKVF